MTSNGGSDEAVVALLDMHLYTAKMISDSVSTDEAVHQAYFPERKNVKENNFFDWVVSYIANPNGGRRAELLENPDYKAILEKYK